MEDAISKVVEKMEAAESKVDSLTSNFNRQFDSYTGKEGNHGDDKTSFVDHFNQIKEEFASVQKEALELGKLQKDALVAFQQNMSKTVQSLQALTNLDPNSEKAKEILEELKTQNEFMDSVTNQL